jgi:hypothetical protein
VAKDSVPQAPLIRLPIKFFQDHDERGLESPEIVKSTQRHWFVRANDPNLHHLLSDAEFYADRWGPDGDGLEGLKASARATIKAIKAAEKE